MIRIIKFRNNKKLFVFVLALAFVLINFCLVNADSKNEISAVLSNVKIKVFDNVLELKDANQKDLKPINYNGSVYVPVRAISNALGYEANYFDKSKQIELTELDESKLTVYYTDTGECYHQDGCVCLRKSKHPITLKDAYEKNFLRHCGDCCRTAPYNKH
jgi:hypothetical protein